MARFLSRLASRLTLVALLGGLALAASALELSDAKARGLVGEQLDGYLGVVKPPASAELQALVDSVNARRRAEYSRIADANGITLEVVRQLAAGKAIERTPAGQWIRLEDGRWHRK
ncbi:MAG: YdbL family protein [Pseudomonadales bacterium]|jgi:uncharacterized protein YdbL (DUF1318 family)|nr:YdbL family protein [Pseudomonadales bacterium]